MRDVIMLPLDFHYTVEVRSLCRIWQKIIITRWRVCLWGSAAPKLRARKRNKRLSRKLPRDEKGSLNSELSAGEERLFVQNINLLTKNMSLNYWRDIDTDGKTSTILWRALLGQRALGLQYKLRLFSGVIIVSKKYHGQYKKIRCLLFGEFT